MEIILPGMLCAYQLIYLSKQIFTEHQLYSRHCSRFQGFSNECDRKDFLHADYILNVETKIRGNIHRVIADSCSARKKVKQGNVTERYWKG